MADQYVIKTIFQVLDKATAPIKKIGSQFGNLSTKMGKVEKDMKKVGQGMSDVGKKMSTRMTLPIVALGGSALKTTADFQESMYGLQAIMGETNDKAMKPFIKEARKLGRDTAFSAKEAADGMQFLAMAGLNQKQVLDAIGPSLDLAAAGNIGLAEAADIATNIMAAFGKEATDLTKINDMLAYATTKSNTGILDLAEAMKPVGPIANVFGIEMSQVTAMLGKMADAGERGGIAGTLLRNAFVSLAKPNKAMIELLDKMGLSVDQFVTESGKIQNFETLMEEIRLNGISATEMLTAFGERGGRAVALLAGEGKNLEQFNREISKVSGTSSDMAKTRMKGLPGAIKELKSAFAELNIAVADSGLGKFAEEMTDKFTGWLRAMSELSPELMSFITIIAGIAAAVGPVLTGFGKFMYFLPSMMKGIFGVAKAFKFLYTIIKTTTLFMMTNPLILLFTAIAVSAYLIYKNWKPIKKFFFELWDSISAKTNEFLNVLSEGWNATLEALGELVTDVFVKPFEDAWEIAKKIGRGIKGIFGGGSTRMKEETSAFDPGRMGKAVSNKGSVEVNVNVKAAKGTEASAEKPKAKGVKTKVNASSFTGQTIIIPEF